MHTILRAGAAPALDPAGSRVMDNNLRFTDSAEVNQYVKPVFRKGWELKL